MRITICENKVELGQQAASLGRHCIKSTIEKFGLGWAPGGRSTLVGAAVAAGYKPEYLVDAGLAVRHDDGSLGDKFRERVMFPIHSVSGRVVAFSGRTLRSDNPRPNSMSRAAICSESGSQNLKSRVRTSAYSWRGTSTW